MFEVDREPWGEMKEGLIKQLVDGGEALCADLFIPQPYYDLVRVGLQPRSQDRTCSLQDLCYTLRLDIKVCPQSLQGHKFRLNMIRGGR